MGSRKYPGRRSLKGWQLTAVVGAAGAMALAGCSSGGSSSSSTPAGNGTASPSGSATPDVFMGDVIWPAQFGAKQLAVPLSDYLPQSYWSQFASGLVKGATYK